MGSNRLWKIFSITVLIMAFLGFLLVQNRKSEKYSVVKIVSPVEIIVSTSKNTEKTVFVKNIQSFVVKPDEKQLELAKKLHISEADSIGLGYLAGNFAQSKLADKEIELDRTAEKSWSARFLSHVGIKTKNSESSKIISNIYIDNQNYGDLLYDGGFGVKNDSKITLQVKKNIEKANKLNLRIFNNKSHKYHKLTCKYGLMAHNVLVLPQSQIPKDARPCKFCFGKHKKFHKFKYKKYFDYANHKWVDYDAIPNVPAPPEVLKIPQMEFYLTDMTRVFKPNNRCDTSVCKALVREVNSAQSTIDFAIYGYTKIPALQNALKNAEARGVKVRFVYDVDKNSANLYPDTLYLATVFKNNNADFAPASRKSKSKYQSAIMHNKFFIFDGKTLLTGSANISNTDMSGFNSNVVTIIRSPEIAQIYEKEFEQMYLGKFHKSKHKIKNKEHITVGNTDVSVYFSPKDKTIENEIIPLVDGAKKYIYMPVFLLSHKELLHHLVAARQRGVAVKVILDATNAHGKNPKHVWLRKNGIPVKTEIFAGKLHSKTMLIDDTYTVIGSMNFSKSGDVDNDENLLIIKNRELTLFYKQFFQYLWKRIPEHWLNHNAMAESPYSKGSCSDGIDNDFDGKIDMADPSCKPIVHKHKKYKKSCKK